MAAITTATFFKYDNLSDKFWAFTQMQLAHPQLSKVEGKTMYKLMGSGAGNGFSMQPDFSTYALIFNWESEKQACDFFQISPIYQSFVAHSSSQQTYFLKAVKAHGKWDGKQPFAINGTLAPNQKMAVLTRATIRKSKMIQFWRDVPAVSKSIEGFPGLIFTKGIGEWPLVQQATLSIWESRQQMVDFAYHSKVHAQAIRKTRELGWFTEELFAEFEVLSPLVYRQAQHSAG